MIQSLASWVVNSKKGGKRMENCKVIAITNQKGGVGKTTTTVNLGVGLANTGNKVLLILRRKRMHFHLPKKPRSTCPI